jgi:small subunit ribosomal protein S7
MRRKHKKKFEVLPDSVYQSLRLAKFINQIMKKGEKNTARKVVYGALDAIKEQLKTDNPLEVFETAMRNVAPVMEVRSRRVGGANYQVPVEVRPDRRNALAIRWIIEVSRAKHGSPMSERLATELIAASKNEGEAIKKRENTHKMAEANKAFAHFSW